jgi:rRNA maturation protein Nop10
MRKVICETCGTQVDRPNPNRFCSSACYGQSRVGTQLAASAVEKIRAAQLANNPMKGRRHTEATRAKMRAASSRAHGPDAIGWKGGRTVDKHGYVLVYAPDHPNAVGNYVPEHRLVMSAILERPLRDDEEVHHKNGVRTDNSPENLEVLTKGEHARLHRLDEAKRGLRRRRASIS